MKNIAVGNRIVFSEANEELYRVETQGLNLTESLCKIKEYLQPSNKGLLIERPHSDFRNHNVVDDIIDHVENILRIGLGDTPTIDVFDTLERLRTDALASKKSGVKRELIQFLENTIWDIENNSLDQPN